MRMAFRALAKAANMQIILTPDGEESLEDEVEGDPVEDGADGKRLDQVEGAEHNLSHRVSHHPSSGAKEKQREKEKKSIK